MNFLSFTVTLIVISMKLNYFQCEWKSNMFRNELIGVDIRESFFTNFVLKQDIQTSYGNCLRSCSKLRECLSGYYIENPNIANCIMFSAMPTAVDLVADVNTEKIFFYKSNKNIFCLLSETLAHFKIFYIFFIDKDRPCQVNETTISKYSTMTKPTTPVSLYDTVLDLILPTPFMLDSNGAATSDISLSTSFVGELADTGTITCFEPDVLLNYTKLETIKFMSNQNYKIPFGLFNGLTRLKTVIFNGASGKGLKTLPNYVFQGLVRLKCIDLIDNQIDFNKIDARNFAGLRSLEVLKINTGNTGVLDLTLLRKYCGCSVTIS
jgi:hypothetical protein